ncbi:MAG: biopolymer transporter ExbD [Ferruginibacter sp.]|nr:biopolymer transporter ExbD [Cytophagales bacterium]
MAQINASSAESKRLGKVRRKKTFIHLDMTPMVDLAFLLLTFFMLTTVFSKPQALPLALPDQPADSVLPPVTNAKNVLTFVLGGNNRVYWYAGEDVSGAKLTDYSSAGIRRILLANRENRKLWVFIKPDDASSYQNVVTALDEMAIAAVQHHSLADLGPAERGLVKGKVSSP